MHKNIVWLMIWIVLGIGSVYGSYFWFISQKDDIVVTLSPIPTAHSPIPQPSPFSFIDPPTESLTATVAAQTGEVKYISRIATEAAILDKKMLVQGESIQTGLDGMTLVAFNASLSAQLAANSQLTFIQTLPHSIVLEQNAGTVTYTNQTNTKISVRIRRLLTQFSQADGSISYDNARDTVLVSVQRGEITVAFNDAKYVSQVATISAGERVVFDNAKRKLR